MEFFRLCAAGRAAAALLAVSLASCMTVAPFGFLRAEELSPSCRAALEAKLAEVHIAPGEIREQSVSRRSTGGEARQFLGYSAWLKLTRCQGSVVVDLGPDCRVEQAYSRGDCTIEGLRRW